MPRKTALEMDAGRVYEALVAKAERKGRTRSEVDECACWLTGYTPEQLAERLRDGTDYGTLMREAPRMNPACDQIKGVVCGVRVEKIEDPIMRRIRWMDKLVDELAKGRPLETILRKPTGA